MRKNILTLKFFFTPKGAINSEQFVFGMIVLAIFAYGIIFFLNNFEIVIKYAIPLFPAKALWVVLLPAAPAILLILSLLLLYSSCVLALRRLGDIYKDGKMEAVDRIFFIAIAVLALILLIAGQSSLYPIPVIPIIFFLAVKKGKNREAEYDFADPKLIYYIIASGALISLIVSGGIVLLNK